MARKKLVRFQENAQRENVVEPGKPLFGALKGNWNNNFFNRDQDLVLEIGCGHGDYTIELARMFPEKNFLGIDIKGARIWRGSLEAEAEGLSNVGFLRVPVQRLDEHFASGEVSEIWITFPDPRPKKRDIKRRLTSPRYLELYAEILKPGGRIHLKTDSLGLYTYTLEVLAEINQNPNVSTADLYSSPFVEQTFGIQTTYEKRFLAEGVPIKYLQFGLPQVTGQNNHDS